jgi:DNA-binding YbaB/EbfC family protein
MGALVQQAQQMQEQMAAAQRELAEVTVTGSAGGGLVEATVSGLGEIRGLRISPEAADPQDTETLADLVVAAIHDANRLSEELQQEKLGPLAQLGQGGFGGGAGGASFPLGF